MGDSIVFENKWYYYMIFTMLFVAYYFWDTAQSQRNRFRMMQNGTYIKRNTFPQLPYGTLPKNAKHLTTKTGSKLLIDGWWAYARKINYFSDIIISLSWGLICGFQSIIPYFYFFFFFSMIIHRVHRDLERCKRKYGKDWDIYCEKVPYLFIPYIF
jgi:delta24(24(1))-sterol reductase